mmetsp:Transcript_8880/g.13071  ORF Transcript_8880/g.13071 Transcript_8880/m.13071 type:complete len:114 (-) Transcript_8880:864-1205(-)
MSLVLAPLYYKYIYNKGYLLLSLQFGCFFQFSVVGTLEFFCFLFLLSNIVFGIFPYLSYFFKQEVSLSLSLSIFFSQNKIRHTNTHTCVHNIKKNSIQCPPPSKKHSKEEQSY